MLLAAHPRVLAYRPKPVMFRLLHLQYWVRLSTQHPSRSCQSGLVEREPVCTYPVLSKGSLAPKGASSTESKRCGNKCLRDAQKPGYELCNTCCKRSVLTVHYPSPTRNSRASSSRTRKRTSEHGDIEFELSTLN